MISLKECRCFASVLRLSTVRRKKRRMNTLSKHLRYGLTEEISWNFKPELFLLNFVLHRFSNLSLIYSDLYKIIWSEYWTIYCECSGHILNHYHILHWINFLLYISNLSLPILKITSYIWVRNCSNIWLVFDLAHYVDNRILEL